MITPRLAVVSVEDFVRIFWGLVFLIVTIFPNKNRRGCVNIWSIMRGGGVGGSRYSITCMCTWTWKYISPRVVRSTRLDLRR